MFCNCYRHRFKNLADIHTFSLLYLSPPTKGEMFNFYLFISSFVFSIGIRKYIGLSSFQIYNILCIFCIYITLFKLTFLVLD